MFPTGLVIILRARNVPARHGWRPVGVWMNTNPIRTSGIDGEHRNRRKTHRSRPNITNISTCTSTTRNELDSRAQTIRVYYPMNIQRSKQWREDTKYPISPGHSPSNRGHRSRDPREMGGDNTWKPNQTLTPRRNRWNGQSGRISQYKPNKGPTRWRAHGEGRWPTENRDNNRERT